MTLQAPANSPVWDAWEKIHGAMYDALHDVDSATLEFLAERAENNDLVREVAQDLLDIRAEKAEPCSCRLATVHPTDIDPPDMIVDRNCPTHGRDPDEVYDRMRDGDFT